MIKTYQTTDSTTFFEVRKTNSLLNGLPWFEVDVIVNGKREATISARAKTYKEAANWAKREYFHPDYTEMSEGAKEI